jgi:hypothetical protein
MRRSQPEEQYGRGEHGRKATGWVPLRILGRTLRRALPSCLCVGGVFLVRFYFLGAGTEQAKLGLFSILQEESNRGWTGQGVDGLFKEVTLRIIGFPGAE